MLVKISILLLALLISFCNPPEFNNPCDPESKSYLETAIILKLANNQEAGCLSPKTSSNSVSAFSLSYPTTDLVFTTGLEINVQKPNLIGTAISCIAEPSMPQGLILGGTNCEISGKPTVSQSATNYKITASNGSENSATNINITISSTPPTSLVYSNNPFVFTNGLPIITQTPTYLGTVTNCVSAPALPTGLTIDATTCSITGTPSVNQGATTYNITASNAFGSTSTSISITVNISPPSALAYTGSPYTFTNGVGITAINPTFSGTVTNCVAAPGLPTGLSINATTCSITGTPSVNQGATAYTITASNAFGNTTANINITVNIAPPSSLAYSGSPYTFTNGVGITAINPTFSGTVTNCVSAPALPTGLSINATTCSITGTPSVNQGATAYTITASNGSGNTTANINISVIIPPPSALVYTGSPFTFTNGQAITTISPTFSGTVTNCVSAPGLPTGLSINATTCAISGTPSVTQGATAYTITASNASGNTTANINITVIIPPPSSLAYTGSPYTFTNGLAITALNPTFSGTVTNCVSAPGLPTGLSINATTCAITGTPSANQGATAYTITASNSSGNTTANINITVNIAPPSSLVYSGSPYTFTNGIAITTVTPTFSGTVTNCVSAPGLPAGLSINATTCAISGTPSVNQGATAYTITASNGSGNTTANINITINIAPPSSLAYAGSPYSLTNGLSITTITPTFSGTVTNCVSAPTLPTGLSISATTCAITGTPTTNQGATAYTITASNGSGSTNANITISIVAQLSKDITAFSFNTPPMTGDISGNNISVTVPFGTNVTNLVAVFTHTGANVQVSAVPQTSGVTANNFSTPKTYVVTAADTSTKSYIVTVTVLPTSGKAYLARISAGVERKGSIETLGGASQTFTPASTFLLTSVVDTQRDILYVGFGGAGENYINVYANASTNANTLTRTITVTPMLRIAAMALDTANDRLYVINRDTSATPSINRFIFQINNASTRNGSIIAGTDYFQVTSTFLHASNQSVRRMTLDTQRDILYVCEYGANSILAYDNPSTFTHSSVREPNRTITTIPSPAGIAIDMTNNILFVSSYTAHTVSAFDSASTINGAIAPNRVISNGVLNNPSGIQFIYPLNRLYIANYTGNNAVFYNNARSLNGNIAPTLTSGAITNPSDISIDITR